MLTTSAMADFLKTGAALCTGPRLVNALLIAFSKFAIVGNVSWFHAEIPGVLPRGCRAAASQ
jgi:hypothetical protein